MSDGRISLNDLPVDNNFKNSTGDETVQETLQSLEDKKQAHLKITPQDDSLVRKALELIGQPEALENEEAPARRERLATILFVDRDSLKKYYESDFHSQIQSNEQNTAAEGDSEESDDDEEFYTPASKELRAARRFILEDSIQRSRKRIQQKRLSSQTNTMPELIHRHRSFVKSFDRMSLAGSQVVSTRPISRVKCTSDGQYVAVGSWGGDISVQTTTELQEVSKIEDSTRGKIGGLAWNSDDTLLIGGGEDTYIKLYNFDKKDKKLQELKTFKGHEARVSHVKFHPSNKYIASASFDTTWRLWDVETGTELLLQEGYSKEVYALDFQQDGALLCTGGMDNIGLVWDIRAGNKIMELNGHTKPIYAAEWSPNSYEVATGGGDGLINIWDIRHTEKACEILAHQSIITDLNFSHNDTPVLVSSSYDKRINIYSAITRKKIKTLEGHTDKILTVDVSQDAKRLISGGWDRSIKLWEE